MEYFFVKSIFVNEGNGRKVVLKCFEFRKENIELLSLFLEWGEGICFVDYILFLIKFLRINFKIDIVFV